MFFPANSFQYEHQQCNFSICQSVHCSQSDSKSNFPVFCSQKLQLNSLLKILQYTALANGHLTHVSSKHQTAKHEKKNENPRSYQTLKVLPISYM